MSFRRTIIAQSLAQGRFQGGSLRFGRGFNNAIETSTMDEPPQDAADTAPTPKPRVVASRKQPPLESSKGIRVRGLVIMSFWDNLDTSSPAAIARDVTLGGWQGKDISGKHAWIWLIVC